MAQQSETKATEPDIKPAREPTGSPTAETLEKDGSSEMLASYGTRSRNRTGRSRPNYAEDKDYDVEMYDYDHDKHHGDSKKASRQASQAANSGEATRGNASSRKSLGDDSKGGSSQNGSKEATPAGTTGSSQAAQTSNGATQPSRKRKAATAAQQANSNAVAVSSRRGATTAKNSTTASPWPETNMLTFTNNRAQSHSGRVVADDGTVLEANDHVYLVCEPPGEPYYLGRIMEFLHPQNDTTRPVDAVRINWFYRPRDIGRKVTDTRVVFATMHSDISPLTALRGKCQIRHRVEVDSMEAYRRTPDNFWFEKLYDRYIQKNYDLIPTSSIVNVPEKVKKVLDDRWKFVLVEQGRGKELTSAVKLCKRCSGYCASNDSVDCAVCQNTYHMNCVRPPLLKKPSRGFAWSCAACSRAQERKLEARHTPSLNDPNGDADEDELLEEEDDDALGADTGRSSPDDKDETHHQGTAEQIYNASLWPWRYLGMHCKPEDALDYDDRIYPRASTRIGPRHQAQVGPWPGRPVQYVKPPEKKKGKKAVVEEPQAADLYPDGKRPKWVQDMPPGYTTRGEDPVDMDDPNATSTPIWIPPTSDNTAHKVEAYMNDARAMSKQLGLPDHSTNLQTVALQVLLRNDYNSEKALKDLAVLDKAAFDEPNPTPIELKKFEEAVGKYGSELHLVMKHVKTMSPGHITRYYYAWKKSERGQSVWTNYSGRKGKKEAKKAEAAATKVADDLADDEDDSAFDSGKANERKRAFMCQFCSTTSSRRWRRAPNAAPGLVNENGVKATSKDKGSQYIVALCTRCAELWRRYAIRWEDIDEISKKVAQAGKAWKRKQDEELLKELQAANERGLLTPDRPASPINGTANGTAQEPPRKKIKASDKEADSDGGSGSGPGTKKKDKAETPVVPDLPKPRTLPCAICDQLEPMADHLSCRECRLSVHRNCYGIVESRGSGKWTCDMCINDKSPQVSTNYKCVLCPIDHTEQELVEQPKLTHHKKKMSEKDREKERLEVQQARKALEAYRKKQEDLNRPLNPREPLKRTADNNWVHVTCAVFTPEVKFGNAKAMEPSEGIPSIPRNRYDEACGVCNETGGACVNCLTCRVPYHVECARRHGHCLGFDIITVKNTRRDQAHIVTLKGVSGTMAAGLWCKDHVPTKTVVHQMSEQVDDTGLNALQFYVQNYKQADLTLTGTVRKANLMNLAAKMSGTAMQAGLRRLSTTTLPNGGTNHARSTDTTDGATEALQPGEKVCIRCGIDVSPRWWPIDNAGGRVPSPFHTMVGKIGTEAEKFVSQRNFQCHKCHSARLPMKPCSPPPPPPPSGPAWSASEQARLGTDAGIAATASATASVLRSPEHLVAPENRDARPPVHAWPQPPSIHTVVQPVHTAASPPAHMNGPRPISGSHAYPTAASAHPPTPVSASVLPPVQSGPGAPYGDAWPRPHSQHGSPPRHINGGLPHGPPLGGLSALRPPAVPGSTAPPPVNHHPGHGHAHSHGPPPYVNGMPPSPRRASGPAPPSPYASPYHPAQHHGPPPPPPPPSHSQHGPPIHGLSNGVHPPPRHEPYPPPAHRPLLGGAHGSPMGSTAGLPPAREPPVSPSSQRNGSDGRPTSGASANPSLRNLLS